HDHGKRFGDKGTQASSPPQGEQGQQSDQRNEGPPHTLGDQLPQGGAAFLLGRVGPQPHHGVGVRQVQGQRGVALVGQASVGQRQTSAENRGARPAVLHLAQGRALLGR